MPQFCYDWRNGRDDNQGSEKDKAEQSGKDVSPDNHVQWIGNASAGPSAPRRGSEITEQIEGSRLTGSMKLKTRYITIC